jgi:exonuclease VII small subunit
VLIVALSELVEVIEQGMAALERARPPR